MAQKCMVCRKHPAAPFKLCAPCAKVHDSTTGDRLTPKTRRPR